MPPGLTFNFSVLTEEIQAKGGHLEELELILLDWHPFSQYDASGDVQLPTSGDGEWSDGRDKGVVCWMRSQDRSSQGEEERWEVGSADGQLDLN